MNIYFFIITSSKSYLRLQNKKNPHELHEDLLSIKIFLYFLMNLELNASLPLSVIEIT